MGATEAVAVVEQGRPSNLFQSAMDSSDVAYLFGRSIPARNGMDNKAKFKFNIL